MIKTNEKMVKEIPISGPQHPTIPEGMAETFGKLYEDIKKNFPEEQFSCFLPLRGQNYEQSIQLCRLTPFEGEDFPANEEEAKRYLEPAIRLMVVGRSVNGWKELTEKTKDEFVKRAADTIVFGDMSWLQDNGQAVNTYVREGEDREYRYNINRSSFFRCARKILGQMKPITTIEQRWFDHIVWGNLYSIAPLYSGNATGRLQNVQLEMSRKLLIQQIEFYKPTHIIFITDWDGWFERFTEVFPLVQKIGDSTKDNVVGLGTYGRAKVVVTIKPDRIRPQKTKEDLFAEDVYNAYDSIDVKEKKWE